MSEFPTIGGRSVVWAACAIVIIPGLLHGQEEGWEGSGELGASFFFGNNTQSLVSAGLAVSHADSTWEIGGDGRYTFGKAEEDDDVSRLKTRNWQLNGNLDYAPFARVSYFAIGGVESSFQRRIRTRTSGGGGVKISGVRNDRTVIDASLALLAEKTDFEDDATVESGDEDLIARWSSRFRARHQLSDERVVMDSETSYRPEADDLGRYTINSVHSVTINVNESIGLKVALIDTYDSDARSRGADSNNDGQLLLSVQGTF